MIDWLDRLYAMLPVRARLFSGGWGAAEGWLAPPTAPAIEPHLVGGRDLSTLEGTFEAPTAGLPAECRTARFELLLPPGDPAAPVCIFFAATGDAGLERRRNLVLPLLREGIGALLLENPYYGARRPPGQRAHGLRLVSDQLAMSRATVEEGLGLLSWLHRRGHRKLGVAGYSMGGSMAAYVGALSPFPLAVVPVATGSTPAPIFTKGLLQRQVDWAELGQAGRERLAALFEEAAIDRLPPPPAGSAAVILAFEADGFVEAETVRRLHEHWPGSELRWLPGGHVRGWLTGGPAIRAAVRDAFARLEQRQG